MKRQFNLNIDFNLLRKQKQWLAQQEFPNGKHRGEVEGLLNLIDAI